jgi:glutaredoxin 3
MSRIQVYTWANCPYCIRAKNLLSSKGLEFEEINLDGKEKELSELREKTGQRTIPQIFIDGKFIGGFSELAQLDAQGALK